MNRTEMINKLNRNDISGVGAIATTKEGLTLYFFFEDMTDSKGIDRAAKQAQQLIDAAVWSKVDYIHKSDSHLYFVDYEAQDGNFTMSSFYRLYNKSFGIDWSYNKFGAMVSKICGEYFKYDYKPATHGIIEVVKIPA
ncbi:MAG: hypothetical protein E7273_12450 [Pseudobutyrivibrio ruminis]|nr:hypothetical protein [Pseudobutyrivibrio ruminis]